MTAQSAAVPSARNVPDRHAADIPDRLFDMLPEAAYVCDSNGIIVRYNRRACELWGRTPRLGDPGERFCGSHSLYRLDGRHLPHWECPMADVLRTGIPVRDQKIVIERPDGSRVVALVNIDPLRDASGAVAGAVNCFHDITGYKRGEEEQRAHPRDLFEVLPAAIYTTDESGRITFYNKAAADLWGHEPELFSSEWCGSWRLRWPDGRPMRHDECPMAVALKENREIRGAEAIAERPDGVRIPFLAYPTPLRDASGKLVGAVNMLIDISERKQAHKLLEERTRSLEALNRLSKSISTDLDLERIVQTVTDCATEMSGARYGAFFYKVVDEHGERYLLYTLSGAPREAFDKLGLPRKTALFEPTFHGAGAVRSDDIRTDPRYGKNAPHFGTPKGHLPVVSYLAVPVISRSGEVHGGLFFAHDQHAVFTKESEDIVTGIAAHAAIAIDNARLLKSAQREVEVRKRAEEELRNREQRLSSIFTQATAGFAETDATGRFVAVNERYCAITGRSREELLQLRMQDITHPDDLINNASLFERLVQSAEPFEIEKRYIRPDGSWVWVNNSVFGIRGPKGDAEGVMAVCIDIGDRKRAEEQQTLLMREMSHRVKNLFAITSSVVALSARTAKTTEDMASAVQDRLGALTRAHELTRPGLMGVRVNASQDTTFHALIGAIFSPYGQKGSKGRECVIIDGPDVRVAGGAVTSLALILHEFATNAAKYGALSSLTGYVKIDCSIENDELLLTWKEHGGPPVGGQPGHEGFGAFLTNRIITGQLGGRFSGEWKREGLIIHLAMPLDRLAM